MIFCVVENFGRFVPKHVWRESIGRLNIYMERKQEVATFANCDGQSPNSLKFFNQACAWFHEITFVCKYMRVCVCPQGHK